jgi:hypothetical protein
VNNRPNDKDGPAIMDGGTVARVRAALSWATALVAVALTAPAQAQGNLDAGKSPARIFSDTCAGCHRNPRDLKRPSAAYLRTHYTTGPVEAAQMAGYLANLPNEARATPPRPPTTDLDRPERPERVDRTERPPADLPNVTPPPGRQPQAKAAQAAAKKGRVVAEPRTSAYSPAIMIDSPRPPELPEPPPIAPPPVFLEPFEE